MRKGFTLIEVIIAILLLSVSTLAVIAMQTSTLRGYSSIRDNDDAVMIAHRTADLLHINATTWRANDTDPWSFAANPPYSGGDSPFDRPNPLNDIFTTQWAWIALFDTPVDGRMTNSATRLGRHCVYVRGGPFLGGLTTTINAASTVTGSPAMVIQIVVISSGIRNTMSSCRDPSNNSPAFNLGAWEYSGGDGIPLGQSLELDGYRPTYHATMVFQRDFL